MIKNTDWSYTMFFNYKVGFRTTLPQKQQDIHRCIVYSFSRNLIDKIAAQTTHKMEANHLSLDGPIFKSGDSVEFTKECLHNLFFWPQQAHKLLNSLVRFSANSGYAEVS